MNYRKEIDGLRGIAVLAVVANHAAPDIPFFEGGFIGVDVFFVISGYLITTIITSDLSDNNFSFRKFWGRRIRRILPSLILMLGTMVPILYFALSPYLRRELLKHTVFASSFTSNFSSIGSADYFGAQVLNPLLHLWSLAIEEQFYLFWPIVCFITFKFAGPKAVKILSVIIFSASFVANLTTIYYFENIPLTFYYPHTRAWELMAGAILAQVALKQNKRLTNKLPAIQRLSSIVGILLLGSGLLFIREATFFPGYWSLLPVLGTSALILGGARPLLARVILTNRLIVWFGTISYALYLWHFPMLFLLREIRQGPTDKLLTIFVVALSIAVANVTTNLFERPIRFGGLRWIPSRFYLITLAAAGLSVFSFLILIPEPRNDSYILEKIEGEGRSNQNLECLRFRKEISVRTFIRNKCYEPYIESRPTVFLVGDSHAASLRIGLKPFLATKRINLLGSSIGGCMWTNFEVDQGKLCRDINSKVFQEMRQIKPDLVIIDNYWSKLARYGPFEQYLLDYISDLNKIGIANVIIVGQIPTWGENGLPLFLLHNFSEKGIRIPTRHPRLTIENDSQTSNQENMRSIKYPKGVTFLSMDDLLCNKQGCLTMVGSNLATDLIVWDYGHLTTAGSKYVSERLFADIEKLIKN